MQNRWTYPYCLSDGTFDWSSPAEFAGDFRQLFLFIISENIMLPVIGILISLGLSILILSSGYVRHYSWSCNCCDLVRIIVR